MASLTFQDLKFDVMSVVGLSKDALHVYVGLIVFLVAAAVVKPGLRSRLPLLAVFLVALLGEILDVRYNLRTFHRGRLMASVHDLVNTMFWPLALWLLARYSRVMKA